MDCSLPGSSVHGIFLGFSRQEYWSGLPFPSLGDLLDPGIACRSPALEAGALLSELPGKMPWRRERQPTPVFWPGEFHGLYSPVATESDTTEWLSAFTLSI